MTLTAQLKSRTRRVLRKWRAKVQKRMKEQEAMADCNPALVLHTNDNTVVAQCKRNPVCLIQAGRMHKDTQYVDDAKVQLRIRAMGGSTLFQDADLQKRTRPMYTAAADSGRAHAQLNTVVAEENEARRRRYAELPRVALLDCVDAADSARAIVLSGKVTHIPDQMRPIFAGWDTDATHILFWELDEEYKTFHDFHQALFQAGQLEAMGPDGTDVMLQHASHVLQDVQQMKPLEEEGISQTTPETHADREGEV